MVSLIQRPVKVKTLPSRDEIYRPLGKGAKTGKLTSAGKTLGPPLQLNKEAQ